MRLELEVCVDRLDTAMLAIEAGATRIEFNKGLALDGLTPSPASCQWLVEHSDVPIISMLRPHDAGFCYSPSEQTCLLADCEKLLETGIAGIAFGAVDQSGALDQDLIARVMQMCADREFVLHRVFDTLPDLQRHLSDAMNLGVTRVLTTGGAPTAAQGIETLGRLVEQAGSSIEILPGAGIHSANVIEIVRRTGCTQIHGSFRDARGELDAEDITAARRLMENWDATR